MNINDTNALNYQISPFITNLSLSEDELISTTTTYESNVYIGTTKGIILHYHHFDDVPEYILISQLQISEMPITRILILPVSKRVVVLAGRIAQVYSLPELSPCHIKRMKDINDIALLRIENQPDSILVLSPTKVRIIQLHGEQIKIVREIHYTNAIAGDSFNPANLIVIADGSNYDIIDIEHNRKIPLFEYRTDQEVSPILTSFYANDTNQSELLLTISSDVSTAIAMFINGTGDVTRGTLTWVGEGYPNGGVVIEWPYALAIFNSEEKSKLVVSSLESLDITIAMNLSDFKQSERIEKNEAIETDKHYSINKLDKFLSIEDVSVKHLLSTKDRNGELTQPLSRITTDILIHNQKEIWSIHKTNPIIEIHNSFMHALETENFEEFLKKDISHLAEESKNYAIHLQFLAVLHSKMDNILTFALKQYLNGPIISPKLVLHLLGGSEYKYDKVFVGLEKIIEDWKDEPDLELLKRYITALPSQYWTPELRRAYYRNATESEVLEFFKKDSFWNSYDDLNKELIELFITKSLSGAILEAYETLFEHDNDNRLQIASLYANILSEDLSRKHIHTAIKLLGSNTLTDKDYGKLLLEVIRVDKDKGVEFMRSKAAKRYNDINRAVTKELSDSSKGFAILSIELLESSFLEDTENQEIFDELLETISTTMISSTVCSEEAEASYDLLLREYEAINSLEKDKWPKISWLDFVSISGKSKDSETLFVLYLKSFELCWVKYHKYGKVYTTPDHKLFQYHQFIAQPNIEKLLAFHDYSNAETVAIINQLALPKQTFYFPKFTPEQKKIEEQQVQQSLLGIFKFYLKLYEEERKVEPAIEHFVETYSKSHISPVDLLEIIPNSFPLIYLLKFLEHAIVDLKSSSRETNIRKVVTKSESSRIKKLYQDFLTV
ncbi:uncharacterized protein SPAPADRAFT_147568 [Spathaspora passalidarum NRRL Y-27907]|uniref:CNH domain-containing protein n=1 Tax=Spathaspora passalidarum (strain NRRL Y-27907 / 11-Y1) TaxID=619300 RepID=G3AIA4_SPAPN|nr:uncharacterized protein SPAPADRAFT_147568 [Spathaspora passalidarum NRRL Y-27907]EGW33671.1 hypothetical protein SPAPADRAFT_147568 [Spathaspora passalidarum NRRL Y-27907]